VYLRQRTIISRDAISAAESNEVLNWSSFLPLELVASGKKQIDISLESRDAMRLISFLRKATLRLSTN